MWSIFKKKPVGEQVTFKIKGMHCTSCALNIDGALEDTVGVLNADTSYAKAVVKVVYDPEKVSEKKLISIINAQGYQVS